MWFRVVGPIRDVEVIASGRAIRELTRLRKAYGGARWRKLKGVATIEFPMQRWLVRRYTGTRLTASDDVR